MYTPDGYVSAQWMRLRSNDYSRHFRMDKTVKSLTHPMTVSPFPGWVGQTEPRVVRLEGDRLELSTTAPTLSGGAQVTPYLQWAREATNAMTGARHPF
jgi:hypothetical protein